MSKDLVINVVKDCVFIAILENNKLVQLHKESIDKKFSVGDLYLGRVNNIIENLNAAFINIGANKDAFLHYQDLGPQVKSFIKFISNIEKNNKCKYSLKSFIFESNINKEGFINDVLNYGQNILVQITKESIYNKGPRLTSEISIAGRYLVIIPFSDKIYISQKIKDFKERERLMKIIEKIKPYGFGVIIRTVAQDKTIKEINIDLLYLKNKWKKIIDNFSKTTPPYKILSESDKASCILRDTFNNDFSSIICNDSDFCKDIRSYLNIIAPNKVDIIYNYKGDLPIFEKYGIERQIKVSFGKNVPFSDGSYLIIEHTEALHVIDVNSGRGRFSNKNSNALEINILAATEIARQLILRDMGGIIVIDFIDMLLGGDKKKLYEHLKNEMEKDKSKHKILPPSKFGLVQITRQRVRRELNIITNEPDPNKNSSKYIMAPLAHIYYIESVLSAIIKNKYFKNICLHVHPFIAAYLKYGFFSIRLKWFFFYKKWIGIISRDSFRYLEYKFINEKKEVIFYYKN